jgi:hypothetical protein
MSKEAVKESNEELEARKVRLFREFFNKMEFDKAATLAKADLYMGVISKEMSDELEKVAGGSMKKGYYVTVEPRPGRVFNIRDSRRLKPLVEAYALMREQQHNRDRGSIIERLKHLRR